MRVTRLLLAFAAICTVSGSPLANAAQEREGAVPSRSTKSKRAAGSLKSFASSAELRQFVGALVDQRRRETERRRKAEAKALRAWLKAQGVEGPTVTVFGESPLMETVTVAGAAAPEAVTNVQHAGIDEGGIVKRHGDHLVVLRRGRVFTIAIGDGRLEPVSMVDAFAPGLDPDGSWYDEMLVSDGTVVVIGYSYQRRATELGLFDIDPTGHLAHRATYQLRSGDYFSGSNYTSRLIGTTLLFYTTAPLALDDRAPIAALPALRRWRGEDDVPGYRTIASPTRVLRPISLPAANRRLSWHSLISCDLAARGLECDATVLLADSLDAFYVSPRAAYAWTTTYGRPDRPGRSVVYRMPFDGGPVAALQVTGTPHDQLSFLESADGYLNVLTSRSTGGAVLARLPLDAFADGSTAAPLSSYEALSPEHTWITANRFIGRHLLFGTARSGEVAPTTPALVAVEWGATERTPLSVAHYVDRIEAMGDDAVALGTAGRDLHLTAVALDAKARVAFRFRRSDVVEAETRSHAFFYRADRQREGVFGFPVFRTAATGLDDLEEDSAAIMLVRHEALAFSDLGALEASAGGDGDDHCRASCVDWYGNARPLFVWDRILGLMGYEVVEGRLVNGRLEEVARVSFAPPPAGGHR